MYGVYIYLRRIREGNPRWHFFSAGSACDKNTKWRISAVVFEKNKKNSPVLKSPTHIGFIGVKKMGRKSQTWAPLSIYYFVKALIFMKL